MCTTYLHRSVATYIGVVNPRSRRLIVSGVLVALVVIALIGAFFA